MNVKLLDLGTPLTREEAKKIIGGGTSGSENVDETGPEGRKVEDLFNFGTPLSPKRP